MRSCARILHERPPWRARIPAGPRRIPARAYTPRHVQRPRSTTTGSLRKASADGGPLRVGIDTGGTFTDVVLEGADAAPRVVKVRSTPDDPGRALLEGLDALGLTAEERARVQVVHGTTVALNALLQRSHARRRHRHQRGLPGPRGDRPPGAPGPVRPRARPARAPRTPRAPLRARPADRPGRGRGLRRGAAPHRRGDRPRGRRGRGQRGAERCGLPAPQLRGPRPRARRGVAASARGGRDGVRGPRRRVSRSRALLDGALQRRPRPGGPALPRPSRQALGGTGLDVLASSGAASPPLARRASPCGSCSPDPRAASSERHGRRRRRATLRSRRSTWAAPAPTSRSTTPRAGSAPWVRRVRVAGHAIAVPTLDMHTIGCGGGSLARVDAAGSPARPDRRAPGRIPARSPSAAAARSRPSPTPTWSSGASPTRRWSAGSSAAR